MGVKKVTYFGQELVNHAGATVDATTLAKSVKAWDAKGDLITGTLETATYYTGETEPASSLGVNGDLYCKLKSGDA